MTPPHGPSGSAPTPPPWLKDRSLPIEIIPEGQMLHRVHRSSLDPVFFGPGAANPPTHRFDSASGLFGILYLGHSRNAAIAETILRNPQRLMVPLSDITGRSASRLVFDRPLRLVQMHGAGLQVVGTDNAISTGPYEPCGLWADAFFNHPDTPDGLTYRSRHDPDQICIALFERPALTIAVADTIPLTAILKEVAAILDNYGKSISTAI